MYSIDLPVKEIVCIGLWVTCIVNLYIYIYHVKKHRFG